MQDRGHIGAPLYRACCWLDEHLLQRPKRRLASVRCWAFGHKYWHTGKAKVINKSVWGEFRCERCGNTRSQMLPSNGQ